MSPSRSAKIKWLELRIDCPSEFAEPLSSVFYRYANGGVVIEQQGGYNPDEGETAPEDDDITVVGYLRIDETLNDAKAQIEVAVKLIGQLYPLAPIREKVMVSRDWELVARSYFQTLRITDRLVVTPSWRSYVPSDSEIVLHLDPGMAFGTGYHPTTRMCLQQVDEVINKGDVVVDVGIGSGILSIAALKLGATRSVGFDIDADAITVATENARSNGVDSGLDLHHGTVVAEYAQDNRSRFDICFANISADATLRLANLYGLLLKRGGVLIASGIVSDRFEECKARLEGNNFRIVRHAEEAFWSCIVAERI